MIALPHALPFIRIGSSSLALCKTEWLTETLTNATHGTDVPGWMAEDISRGVESYLVNHYRGSVIDSEELFDRIEKTLSSLGLKEVAANIDKTPPPVRISLNELARRAGSGYELIFFRLLGEQLQSALFGGAHRIEFYGMRSCVKRMTSTRKWSTRCDRMRDEIDSYIDRFREEASLLNPELAVVIAS